MLTDPEKQLAIVKQANLCFNCLGHHKVSQCKSKYRCKTCTRKHHTSLCNPQKPPNNDTREQTPETPNGQPIHATLTPATPTSILNNQRTGLTACLLKTAISTVSLANQRVVANILFDEGAQCSFITCELADKLNACPQQTKDIQISTFGGAQPTSHTLQ